MLPLIFEPNKGKKKEYKTIVAKSPNYMFKFVSHFTDHFLHTANFSNLF